MGIGLERLRGVSRPGNGAEDLCASCHHAELCAYCGRGRDPVLGCEGYLTASPIRGVAFSGLCPNCVRRFACSREKPAGGVWHCEEYC